MVFFTTKEVPRKLSEVCLELNDLILSKDFHEDLRAFKSYFIGSNIDGPSLSDAMMRILPSYPIEVSTTNYMMAKWSFNRVIYINSKYIEEIEKVDYARVLGLFTVNQVNSKSAYWFDDSQDIFDRSNYSAHTVVGDITVRHYLERRRIKSPGDNNGKSRISRITPSDIH